VRLHILQVHCRVLQLELHLLSMSACTPHGRDYPMSPVDAGIAREAHFEFYRIIADLEDQYTNIAIDLMKGTNQ